MLGQSEQVVWVQASVNEGEAAKCQTDLEQAREQWGGNELLHNGLPLSVLR